MVADGLFFGTAAFACAATFIDAISLGPAVIPWPDPVVVVSVLLGYLIVRWFATEMLLAGVSGVGASEPATALPPIDLRPTDYTRAQIPVTLLVTAIYAVLGLWVVILAFFIPAMAGLEPGRPFGLRHYLAALADDRFFWWIGLLGVIPALMILRVLFHIAGRVFFGPMDQD